jgi:hypothetical protein
MHLYLSSMYAYLRDNHWDKLAYVYVVDEPNSVQAYNDVRARARFVHEVALGLKVLCTKQPQVRNRAWGRAQQHNGVSTRHIRSLQVVGDVPADCASYVSSFFDDLHGQYTEDFLATECAKRRPFFHLSWIAFPVGQSRIELNDEEFIRFTISDSLNVLDFAGNPKNYFGFAQRIRLLVSSATILDERSLRWASR